MNSALNKSDTRGTESAMLAREVTINKKKPPLNAEALYKEQLSYLLF